jgi:phosphatidylglycerophosphate synthase
VQIEKINDSLLSRSETLMIDWLCQRVPQRIRPDHLTLFGLVGAVVVFGGFALSNLHPGYLWLAVAGIAMNWAGDSLDGSLARFRRAERRRYGYFLDHMTDSFSMSLVGIGAGLSPLLSMSACLLVLITYLLLTVLSVLEAKVRNVMRISFGRLGPTEFRVLLLVLISFLYFHPALEFAPWGQRVSAYDAALMLISAMLFIVCIGTALRIGQELAGEDPGPR